MIDIERLALSIEAEGERVASAAVLDDAPPPYEAGRRVGYRSGYLMACRKVAEMVRSVSVEIDRARDDERDYEGRAVEREAAKPGTERE